MHVWIAYTLLLVAVGMDLKSMRISNRLILIGLGISLVRRFICEGMVGVFTGLILILIPVVLLYLLFLVGALGAGDIKLFSLVGSFINLRELIWCIIFAFFYGAIISLGKILGMMLFRIPFTEKQNLIHFSVAIFLGFTTTRLLIA